MTHASKKIQNLDEQIILLPSQRSWVGMLGTILDYVAQIGPPATIIEVFPRNESYGTQFLSFTAKAYKEHDQRSSMAIIPGLKK